MEANQAHELLARPPGFSQPDSNVDNWRVCSVCGSLVQETGKHRRWHEAVGQLLPVGKRPPEQPGRTSNVW
ncbi:hypothetical protein GCM10009836_68940 [Pseudonocardia ailaonensis]|uniref:C2H2-type domain-containing protein n=1 Tax=Pseudonocardia ailaonensis TaxID=367279 RepID=A0ABN2NNI1_9PSEU